jgi:hypothetical protein
MTQLPERPNSAQLLSHMEAAGTPTPAIFGLKVSPDSGMDIVTPQQMRLFYWRVGAHDHALAGIAGWRQYSVATGQPDINQDEQVGVLNLPPSTRPASHVLSSVPAWDTEKAEILQFVSGYAGAVVEQFGAVDVGVTLGAIGVPRLERERGIFVAPPHRLSSDPQEVAAWYANLMTDVSQILEGDSTRDTLIADMVADFNRVGIGV